MKGIMGVNIENSKNFVKAIQILDAFKKKIYIYRIRE
jgi:uncharacterized protein YuzE